MNNLALPRQLRSSLTNRIRFSSGATAISSSLSSSAAAATATVRHTTIKTVTTITSSHAICYRSLSSSSTSRTSSPLKLTKDEVEASLRLIGYQGTPFPWLQTKEENAITKTFSFADFNQAWSFMTRAALLAEKLDHHPEWSNVYNIVEVKLTTHDCNGISQKDIDMARSMEAYASDLMPDGKKSMFVPSNST